jgi:hypothetical protein
LIALQVEFESNTPVLNAMSERLAQEASDSTRVTTEAASSLRKEMKGINDGLLVLKKQSNLQTEDLDLERTNIAEAPERDL